MKATGLEGGMILGKTIDNMKKAQFTNRIKTKREAIKFLKSISDSI